MRQLLLGISAFEPFSFSLFFQPSLEQAILEVLSKLTWSILFKGCLIIYSAKNDNFMFILCIWSCVFGQV